jgi:quinol monooxygenase YgiN
LEEFKRLQAMCLESVRTRDTGTLQYECFFSGDYGECLVVERYRDSEALLEHSPIWLIRRRHSLRRALLQANSAERPAQS